MVPDQVPEVCPDLVAKAYARTLDVALALLVPRVIQVGTVAEAAGTVIAVVLVLLYAKTKIRSPTLCGRSAMDVAFVDAFP